MSVSQKKDHRVLSSRIIRNDYFNYTWGGEDGGENKEIKPKTNVYTKYSTRYV